MRNKIEVQNITIKGVEHGDNKIIAKMAGTTSLYVSEIFTGKRNHQSKTGRKIINCARILVQVKQNLVDLAECNGEDFSIEKNYMIPVTKPLKQA